MFKRTKMILSKANSTELLKEVKKELQISSSLQTQLTPQKTLVSNGSAQQRNLMVSKMKKHGRFSKNAIPVLEKLCQMFITL